MEIPSEARIPTPSFCRGENLGLEKESGLLQVTLLAGGRAGTGAQPSGSQPSEPSAVSVPHGEGWAAVARAGSPGIGHAWGGRAGCQGPSGGSLYLQFWVDSLLGSLPLGLVWGCRYPIQEEVCLLCSHFPPSSRKHPPTASMFRRNISELNET